MPVSPSVNINFVLGYTGLIALASVNLPVWELPRWVYFAATPLWVIAALILMSGFVAYTSAVSEQTVYEELGYPEGFQRLPRAQLSKQAWRYFADSQTFKAQQKKQSLELNSTADND